MLSCGGKEFAPGTAHRISVIETDIILPIPDLRVYSGLKYVHKDDAAKHLSRHAVTPSQLRSALIL